MKKDDTLHRLLERSSRARGNVRPPGTCLEAETLAAWTDDSLSPVERAAVEAHAADCERCLAVLAAIARTTPPSAAVRRPSWFPVRWLAPITAAAVAVAVWVIVQEPSRPVPLPAPPSERAVDAVKPSDPAGQPERDAAAAAANPLERKAESDAASRRVTDQTQARQAAKSPAVGGAAAAPQAASPSRPASSTAVAPPPPPVRAEARQERFQAARDALGASALIVSPDANVRWRLAGRDVERSSDGGRTWQSQPTGSETELLAGAAPAPTVCWIVGRSGLVLRSTDGATWQRLPFPEATLDLAAVTARDALDATVTGADGRRYRTTDAGKTWVLQENPAAPF
jgi:hypothetical protein